MEKCSSSIVFDYANIPFIIQQPFSYFLFPEFHHSAQAKSATVAITLNIDCSNKATDQGHPTRI